MKAAFVLAAACLAVVPAFGYVDQTLVESVNKNAAAPWRAGINIPFAGKSLDDIRRTLLPIHHVRNVTTRRPDPAAGTKASIELPTSFDARTQWPRCTSIQQIRDQGECGSCWAFAATEAFTDRYCIESGMKENPNFAAYYMVTCDDGANGCDGGSLSAAWEFIAGNGLPTTACQPYNVPTCKPSQQPCLPPFVSTPSCPGAQCTASGQTWAVQKATGLYQPGCSFFSCSADKMAEDLVANGPFEVSMEVYSDFVHYKSGVYTHTGGQLLGGHAVKVIGFGEENGTPYWLIANSWTTTWGDKGTFKIRRGTNEVGIESNTYAGKAASFQ
eukprot:TRINITY_DN67393_c0_g1_i1.p1 TRINITY_DN67393_c0_g1~~TRINITY_DN67393_c0_g1_i1.p1  ORF type:complete len:339 (+),score=77.49 TRINITY_DN67393_c0_g1_i1:32-1018(+)